MDGARKPNASTRLDGCVTDPEPNVDSGQATVRNMRSKCRCSYVLQFTFRRAVCCVLHRPPSQVIHCTVLFFNNKQLAFKKEPESQVTVQNSSHLLTRGESNREPERRRSSLNGWLSPANSQRGTVPPSRPPRRAQRQLGPRGPGRHSSSVRPPADKPAAQGPRASNRGSSSSSRLGFV